jgi:uncharacterized protein YoxC
VIQDLWTPTGVAPLGAAPVGHNAETGSPIVAHTIMLKATDRFDKVHKMRVQILADKDTSQAEIEDMIGNAAERFVEEVRVKYDKRPPTAEEHKEIGRALNELRQYTKRRVASTTNKIYF